MRHVLSFKHAADLGWLCNNNKTKYGRNALCHPVLALYNPSWSQTTPYTISIYYNMFYDTKFGGPSPRCGGLHFFFSQSAAGLTNQVPVRDFRAGTPFHRHYCTARCYHLALGLISFPHFSGVYCSLFLETVYIILKKQMTKTRPSKVCSNLSQRPASRHHWSTCVFFGSWAVGQRRSWRDQCSCDLDWQLSHGIFGLRANLYTRKI